MKVGDPGRIARVMTKTYRGWTIKYHGAAPLAGTFRAVRQGVAMNSQSEQGIRRMIDLREEDARRRRQAPGGWAPV
jgi:hypothetical protein